MMGKRTPFFDLDRYSSLPRPGPRPVPPHSMLSPFLDVPLLDFDVNNSEAQELRRAYGRSEHMGSEWLQGWLCDTRPGQAPMGSGQGPFLEGLKK